MTKPRPTIGSGIIRKSGEDIHLRQSLKGSQLRRDAARGQLLPMHQPLPSDVPLPRAMRRKGAKVAAFLRILASLTKGPRS